jgi:NTP pyrophosphatase (non-canonical NTP hydrolase)
MPIKKSQKEIDTFYKKQGWPYWSPLSILARLTEEVGEFARVVNHQFGDKKKKASEEEQDLEDEMGDIIYTLACFANSQKLDLDRALARSIHKAHTRDKHRFDDQKKRNKGA